MITIVVADDHHVVREGIRTLLEDEPDFRVVGEAADGPETMRIVKLLQPDVLVVDLKMPGLDGIEVTRQTVKYSPKTQVVILSIYSNEAYVLGTLEAGAKGYVLKESSVGDLVQAIREASAGRYYFSLPLSEASVEAYRQQANTDDQTLRYSYNSNMEGSERYRT